MSSSRHSGGGQQASPSSVPQSLKITDYLRPTFQEAAMIREYCQLAQIQEQQNPSEHHNSVTASQETLNGGGNAKTLTGCYVIPSSQSHYLWFGLLCVSNDRSSTPSPWNGLIVRFFLRFPDNYPSGLPQIIFLPISSQSTSQQQQFTTLTSHPDINPTSGAFNLRAYVSSSSSSISSSTHVPRTYKILRLVRKSFYRTFTDVEVQNCANPAAAEMCGRDYEQFLRNCGVDAAESLKHFKDVDKWISQKFKGDANLILLGGEGQQQQSNGVGEGGGGEGGRGRRGRTLGLSFMRD